ncbi:MAG: asparagine synthase (glutamine-hydrolyzing) [Planctomycetaceae bacterium]
MCGIAGIVAPDESAAALRPVLRRMTDVITHRGPDDDGHVVDDGAGIGMRRLSIIDVAGGHQPIANESGDVHVVCNGEIYNHRELRERLIANGHVFRTSSDTEVLVHLYEELGEACFAQLRGMFGAAIWDRRTQRVVLGRDRLGKKPLFYARAGGKFVFGSEMKSLLAAEPSLREPDYSQLPVYLEHGFLFQPDTMYRAIKKLPAGHHAVFGDGKLTIEPYWSLEFTNETQCDSSRAWAERLDQLLEEAVRIRLESEVPLGVFLSGGLDSSAIVAYAHRAGLRPLKTFTIAFDRPAWDESDDALRVARHFGAEHHVLELSESEMQASAADTLLQLIRHFDEPFGDASALPTYHVSRLAREHVTVILSGDGGDELFAGYSSYRGAKFAELYRRCVPYWLGRHALPSASQSLSRVLPASLSYRAQRVAKVLRDSALPIEAAYREKTSIWSQTDIGELVADDVLRQSSALREEYLPRDLLSIMRADRNLVSRLSELDLRSYMLDDILVKVDRMSMAHSLEVRSPILDHKLVEFAASMPMDLKLRGWESKAILRDVLKPMLPTQTLVKRKQGFSVPLRDWFKNGLSEMVGDYLESGSSRLPAELFSRNKVATVLREHRQGTVDHGRRIWLLLMFAAWHETYQQGNAEMSPAAVEFSAA